MPQHPTHPATVHFPITLTFLTGLLDLFHYASSKSLRIANYIPTGLTHSDLSTLSYHTTSLLLLVSLPAIVTGVIELGPLLQQRDWRTSAKLQTGVAHAFMNNLNVMGALYNWYTRGSRDRYEPSGTNLIVSTVLALPATVFAAYLGGQLVYQYGMGVGRGPRPKKVQ